MGKILDCIVKKGEGNYLCYKTNKVSLNISDTDVLDYDDKPASTRNKSSIAESDLSLVPTVVIDRMLIDYSRPIFRFFLMVRATFTRLTIWLLARRFFPFLLAR